jgi:hypothetical protein
MPFRLVADDGQGGEKSGEMKTVGDETTETKVLRKERVEII